jgi:hypothetical protein
METHKQPNQTDGANTQHGSRWDHVKEAFRHAWASTKAERSTAASTDKTAKAEPKSPVATGSTEHTAPVEITKFPAHDSRGLGIGSAQDRIDRAITQPNMMKPDLTTRH